MHAGKIFTTITIFLVGCNSVHTATDTRILDTPSIVILGIAQDGGVPQAGRFDDARWDDSSKARMIACMGIIDPRSNKRWMINATPDFRRQLTDLARSSTGPARPAVDGIFLTHAHIGHYTGLMFLGHESMGAKDVPVWVMPRMDAFLRANGPWDQLVRYGNIQLRPLSDGTKVEIGEGLSVTPILVPHRQEYSIKCAQIPALRMRNHLSNAVRIAARPK